MAGAHRRQRYMTSAVCVLAWAELDIAPGELRLTFFLQNFDAASTVGIWTRLAHL
jgi:hypothetical protein